jgi:FAD/FMN-containing dehydrogenase
LVPRVMGMDSTQNPANGAADLLATLANPVINARSDEYDTARQTWYYGLERRPELIARPIDAAEVARVVGVARETGLPLAVRGGGHSAAGHGVADGALVLDLSAMKGIEIDVERRTAWAETGLTAGEYTTAATAHGLVTGFGDTGSVGIGGITLAGGVGLLHRSQGLTIDSVLAADIVTADGSLLRVDEQNYPDLFWAIRGGGGNFGVVTNFLYRLRPIDRVVGGMLAFPATPDVAAAILAEAEAAPDELCGEVTIMTLPPAPEIEPRYQNQVAIGMIMVHAGPIDEGNRVFDGFRAIAEPIVDLVQVMPYAAMLQGPKPPQLPFAAQRVWFSDGIDAEAMAGAIEGVARSTALMRVAQIRPLGGAVARVAPEATAFGHRSRRLMVGVAAGYTNAAHTDQQEAWADSMVAAIGRDDGASYIGLMPDATADEVRAAYPAATWERLTRVKAQYDPDNVFRLNHNIPPASS